jgi:hypothetical protein
VLGGSTSVTGDVVVLVAVVVSVVAVGALLLGLRRALAARVALPPRPEEDQPPAGLGRLVPVGAQVDAECRRGIPALERWLWSRQESGRYSP